MKKQIKLNCCINNFSSTATEKNAAHFKVSFAAQNTLHFLYMIYKIVFLVRQFFFMYFASVSVKC